MPYQDEAINQLIINKLSQDQYNELAEAGAISANQLYFVEADGDIDAASGTIENVADPINNTDAANKQYVDNTISSNLSNLSSTVSSTYALKTQIPDAEGLGLSNYAPLSTVTDISNTLSGYATNSNVNSISSALNDDITYVSGQVSGIPNDIVSVSNSLSGYSTKSDVTYVSGQVSSLSPTINDLTSTVETINNNLSSFVPYSTSGTLEFTPIEGIQYGTLSANADGISSYFTVGGNYGSRYKSFSLVGTDSPKLRFWSLYEESDFGEILVSDLNETIYENGSITYNDNKLVFPEESGTLVVNSQLSSYSLSSDVSSTINKVSNIASSLSALSDISQISAEYTIDAVVQKLNEVIIRINTLTTSLK